MKVLVLLLALAATALVPLLRAEDFPDGKGKDLVIERCAGCHGLDQVAAHRANKEGWENVVTYMVSRGMTATDDEYNTIVEYLAKSFPPSTPKPKEK